MTVVWPYGLHGPQLPLSECGQHQDQKQAAYKRGPLAPVFEAMTLRAGNSPFC